MVRFPVVLLITPLLLLGGAPAGAQEPPRLVQPDGTYPTVPLEKDTVVIKVVQNGVRNLQDYENVADGLAANLALSLSKAHITISKAVNHVNPLELFP